MANSGEPLLNVVMKSKPKMLEAWTKRYVARDWGFGVPDRRHQRHRRIGGAYPIAVRTRNVVSPSPSR